MRNAIESYHEAVSPQLSSSLTLKKDVQEGSKDGSINDSKDSGKVGREESEQDIARNDQSPSSNQYKAETRICIQLNLSSSSFDGNVSDILSQPPIKQTDYNMFKKDDSPQKQSVFLTKEGRFMCGPEDGMVIITSPCKKTEMPSLHDSTPKQQSVL